MASNVAGANADRATAMKSGSARLCSTSTPTGQLAIATATQPRVWLMLNCTVAPWRSSSSRGFPWAPAAKRSACGAHPNIGPSSKRRAAWAAAKLQRSASQRKLDARARSSSLRKLLRSAQSPAPGTPNQRMSSSARGGALGSAVRAARTRSFNGSVARRSRAQAHVNSADGLAAVRMRVSILTRPFGRRARSRQGRARTPQNRAPWFLRRQFLVRNQAKVHHGDRPKERASRLLARLPAQYWFGDAIERRAVSTSQYFVFTTSRADRPDRLRGCAAAMGDMPSVRQASRSFQRSWVWPPAGSHRDWQRSACRMPHPAPAHRQQGSGLSLPARQEV